MRAVSVMGMAGYAAGSEMHGGGQRRRARQLNV